MRTYIFFCILLVLSSGLSTLTNKYLGTGSTRVVYPLGFVKGGDIIETMINFPRPTTLPPLEYTVIILNSALSELRNQPGNFGQVRFVSIECCIFGCYFKCRYIQYLNPKP